VRRGGATEVKDGGRGGEGGRREGAGCCRSFCGSEGGDLITLPNIAAIVNRGTAS
jgi:hypothetical protein